MKYTFSFKEMNYGSVEIESANTPTKAEVIDAIESGNAFYKYTDYEDIQLIETEKTKPKKDHNRESR
jgi:hypothetical protein